MTAFKDQAWRQAQELSTPGNGVQGQGLAYSPFLHNSIWLLSFISNCTLLSFKTACRNRKLSLYALLDA